MPTPKSIINRAYRLAIGVGVDATVQPTLDNVWAFEEAFPLALRRAMTEIGHSSSEIENFRRSHDLTVTNGVIALPDAVLDEFLDSSTLSSPDDVTIAELSSFAPRWADYQRPVHDMLHYYTHMDGNLHFREAGGDIGTWNGDLVLYCISMPDAVANITTNMNLPKDMTDRTVEILADMIRGRVNA